MVEVERDFFLGKVLLGFSLRKDLWDEESLERDSWYVFGPRFNEYESLYPCRVHLEKVIDQVFEAGGR